MSDLIIVGGGLAGCEAAWQAAQRGIKVFLYEMRPNVMTGAHRTAQLAELVCSNSLGSSLLDRPSGLLKEELRRMGSLLVDCADRAALPAGGALAVDREVFASLVTRAIESHPNIRIIREEITSIPNQPAIIASGPLTSANLITSIQQLTGEDHLFFFDAIAPVVQAESVDMQIAYRGSRYKVGSAEAGDYINCPMSEDEYHAFVDQLLAADRIQLRDFEGEIREGVRAGENHFFEGCLPVEILAERGRDTLAFGPMRPIGLRGPGRGARKTFAVLQLRQDDLAGSLFNLVGCQTNLTFAEQSRVFRLIPGLQNAEFARYGQMHRNTFIASPRLLSATLQTREYPDLFFAGQITGVEGYMGNIATGLLAGVNAARVLRGIPPLTLPPATMLGALCNYISHANPADFQPMKANFGILPPIAHPKISRRERAIQCVERALLSLDPILSQFQINS
ncbi:tRNA:m(5)U-54 methyltransferase [Longilinea arvoryzae]|uniref:Methylenetetrahydrofolate--tRNA-(uracil-5-)-methyltransferase TrmFO n=1 Tax=Longilinea arvoryzae TaxID=360412 RepID=A0A0S7BLL9_9CHLR|nr:methylenetetrahydrofolate--tRNA-(uracil(54)-C(5))-methyltransferase (FADH(2)-oxidizing) TrmFO [Longilinea arvoryzae]GAP14833.1 tRNA:m(5)U-54 methyltransferase [Longilinea arvoryzae]